MKLKLLFLAVTGCLLGVAVGPAAANHPEDAPHCKQTAGTNACLRVTRIGADWLVHVGIDVSMGPEDVQAILDRPGEELSVSIWGDDGSDNEDDFLIGNVPLLSSGPGPNGYGGDFEVLFIPGRRLNEDDSINNRRDEIVGKIDVFFPKSGQTFRYETGNVNHNF